MTEPGTVPATAQRVSELIELGRDREAAELAHAQPAAVDDHQRDDGGGAMDVLAQLDEVGPLLAGVVGGIAPDQLDAPTPCDEFTVRGVLEHMVGGATAFAAAFRGADAAPPDTTDVVAAFGPALTDLAAAMHAPGAFDRAIQAPFGEVPGPTFARFVVLDGLVHGWDLATATGQPYEPSAALVGAVEGFAQDAIPPLRDGVTFGAETTPPPGATPIERLAALTGRTVPSS